MKIYIPTRGRENQQITWRNLTDRLRKDACLVTHPNDNDYGDYPVITCPAAGIGNVRQWIVQHHLSRYKRRLETSPVCLMLDDDLRFFKRRDDDATKFVPATDGQKELMIHDLERLMNRYAHGGILAREGGNRITDRIKENTRLLRALAYNTKVMNAHSVRFDRLVVMEDFDVALQLLRLGYKSVALCDYVQDQTRSNAPGGCSIYRTLEAQAEGARGLSSLHPNFVHAVTKTTKTAWNGATRLDVTVQWKKAFESAGVTRGV